MNQMKILSDKYRQTMKILNVTLFRLTEEELKTCIECICRFENLKELKIEFFPMNIRKPIDDCFSLIGQKCNKLLKLDLSIHSSVPISDRFFDSFSKFKAIKKLKIRFGNDVKVKGNVKAFKHCKQLNNIEIIYLELTEDFFANIETFVPKLQSLRVLTGKDFSDSFINSFHSMKNIREVYLFVNISANKMTKKYYYFGKSLSEVMLSPKAKDIIPITYNCGLLSYVKM